MIEYQRTACATVFEEVEVPRDPVMILSLAISEVEFGSEVYYSLKQARRYARDAQRNIFPKSC
jgi:hypothetical protein